MLKTVINKVSTRGEVIAPNHEVIAIQKRSSPPTEDHKVKVKRLVRSFRNSKPSRKKENKNFNGKVLLAFALGGSTAVLGGALLIPHFIGGEKLSKGPCGPIEGQIDLNAVGGILQGNEITNPTCTLPGINGERRFYQGENGVLAGTYTTKTTESGEVEEVLNVNGQMGQVDSKMGVDIDAPPTQQLEGYQLTVPQASLVINPDEGTLYSPGAFVVQNPILTTRSTKEGSSGEELDKCFFMEMSSFSGVLACADSEAMPTEGYHSVGEKLLESESILLLPLSFRPDSKALEEVTSSNNNIGAISTSEGTWVPQRMPADILELVSNPKDLNIGDTSTKGDIDADSEDSTKE